ncbi:RCC1 and BTB domain-containing protein 1-like [Cloeon dipterum]|uniref:RCC1 and BTB domain-containing protein 1-like n=1 Tax=Cloeon dipterum TaxID=197152 RepID=UPI0032202B25
MKVGGPLNGKFVTAIACKMHASIALLDSGEVFAWGDNSDDILGLGPLEEMRISIPCKVPGLEEISKIVCGPRHAMALSRDGKLFSWGSNFDGEVGTGPTFELITRPTLIAENIGRIKDVAASNYYEKKPCAAITETDVVFMWGQCRDAIIRSPTKTTFSSLDEVFAKVPTQAATCRALRPEQKQTCSSVNAWLNHFFDDTESADFVFSVEGKKIHVHKLILSMRCAYFRSMYKGSWKESSTSEQTINEYSFTAFYNFLKFFYYDKIDLQPGSLAIFELVRLANFYQMEELQEICEKFMKSNTSVGHAALIYETAVQYGFKELEEFSFSFCMKHFSEVAKTDAFNNLQEDIAKKFLLRAAYLGALAYSS